LIFNWKQEAARFAPELKVLDFAGVGRKTMWEQVTESDIVLTTYGTLLRDVTQLKDVEFDYVILDEAQSIKNAAAQSSKACRLLSARHRLALTGTPIENHLGELWSLFDFLNPGMLGQSTAFQRFAKPAADGEMDGRILLAKAISPFVLRRTKSQVLTDLPEKTEQTIYCDLSPKERKKYDEMKDYFRNSLTNKIKSDGLEKSKIHVLEALLRLRQAACHQGLLDEKKQKEMSAKLETLFEQLDELLAEGHKALIFSQFTSLLAIVKKHLDKKKITYEYLDGQSRNREKLVHRFQTDANCPLFLISLKAGGKGLNLTAADYVFILDPWWNPAVEAQAVDRAHRLGQDKPVFAYRLIARDTVEEKILQLQEGKRQLAESIISADSSLLKGLSAEDLQMLLS
jgi:SNF2 family DNA or RNA helicase